VWREFANAGIRALSISPGPFQAASQSSPELAKQFIADVPMRRFGEPEEIGELVLFLCSDACEFMTADTASRPTAAVMDWFSRKVGWARKHSYTTIPLQRHLLLAAMTSTSTKTSGLIN
jgi:NAD(P)-dependent dehydrogenase (short-subunit alcohol dehydrogenase family)